jgi:hypothetical protein
MVWERKENNPNDPKNCEGLTIGRDFIIVTALPKENLPKKVEDEYEIPIGNILPINRKGVYMGCFLSNYDKQSKLISYKRGDNADTWITNKYYYVYRNPTRFGSVKNKRPKKGAKRQYRSFGSGAKRQYGRRSKRVERLRSIKVSPRKGKKYRAEVYNPGTKKTRNIDFGAKDYQQYKDSTRLKKYRSKNHGDKKRRDNYFSRHSGVKSKRKALNKEWSKSKGKFNAKILSHQYLW